MSEPPEDAQLRQALRVLSLASDRYRQALATALEIGTSETIALGHVRSDGPLTPSELARRMKLTTGSMTALLDRLEKAAFITRQQNPDDRRSVLISATPAGQHALSWAYEQVDEAIAPAIAQYRHLGLSGVAELLTAVAQAMDQRADTLAD